LTVKGSSIIDIDVQSAGKDELKFSAVITLDNLEVKGVSPVADITRIQGVITCTQDSFVSDKLSAMISKQAAIITFKGGYDKNSVTIEQCQLNYGQTGFSLSGKVNDLQNPQISAAVKGSLDLSDIPKLLAAITLPQLGGICSVNVAAQGALNDISALSVKAKAEIPAGNVDAIRFSDVKSELELKQGTAY
jgi:hypothetical protein